jgi:hypothetical protein
VIGCALACLGLGGERPMIDPLCLAGCASQTCADGAYFLNEFLSCAAGAFFDCGNFGCVLTECSDELAACRASTC